MILCQKRKIEIGNQTSDSRLQTSVKGITLVALVITIIILLILAGVAISMITGGDGLFVKANNAATKYNEAGKNEATTLDFLMEEMEDYVGKDANVVTTISLENSTYAFGIKGTVNITQKEKDLDYSKCKYVFTNSQEKIGKNLYLYTDGELTGDTTVFEISKGPGNWYLHVLFTDKAGNKLEQVSSDYITVEESIVFAYTGEEESISLLSGKYQLECWGASGGVHANGGVPGKGGYSVGKIIFTETTPLFINVAGQGGNATSVNGSTGGYNGGGAGGNGYGGYLGGTGGGGATSVALESGLLKDLVNTKDSVLIVAGGGGGTTAGNKADDKYQGGNGGGLNGENSIRLYTTGTTSNGSTQDSGYQFGLGQQGRNGANYDHGSEGNGGRRRWLVWRLFISIYWRLY